MKRRTFLSVSMMIPALTEAYGYPTAEGWEEPHDKPRLKRQLHLEECPDGKLLLKTDAPTTPRKLVKREVIDGIWGLGTYEVMRQPLHWAMIDAGWFDDDELWYPFEGMTPEYIDWFGYYQPQCEAHDLMCDLFGIYPSIMSPRLPDIGLEVGQHPSTPRFVTAKIKNRDWIATFVQAVTAEDAYLEIDPFPRSREAE